MVDAEQSSGTQATFDPLAQQVAQFAGGQPGQPPPAAAPQPAVAQAMEPVAQPAQVAPAAPPPMAAQPVGATPQPQLVGTPYPGAGMPMQPAATMGMQPGMQPGAQMMGMQAPMPEVLQVRVAIPMQDGTEMPAQLEFSIPEQLRSQQGILMFASQIVQFWPVQTYQPKNRGWGGRGGGQGGYGGGGGRW